MSTPQGHLYFLEARRGLVKTCRADGSAMRTLVAGYEGKTPDGIQVDIKNGHVYWTCMGKNWAVSWSFGDAQRTRLTHARSTGERRVH